MKISTKGRYALRLMIDVAIHQNEGYVALRDAAQRQGISVKYLEQIAGMLSKAGMLLSGRGPQGGYRLAKAPVYGGQYPAADGGGSCAGGLSGGRGKTLRAQRRLCYAGFLDRTVRGGECLCGSVHPGGSGGLGIGKDPAEQPINLLNTG